jgi:hypothetical protein
MIHQRRTHPSYVDGCFGCKASTIGFGEVPGGNRPQGQKKQKIQRRAKGLDEYARRRKAGEQPDGTSLEKIQAYDRRMDTFHRIEADLREDNPKDRVDNLQKSASNTQ